MVISAFVGYDMPSWSPLWRQDLKELVLGTKNTQVEVIAEKCIGCHMCKLQGIVCPESESIERLIWVRFDQLRDRGAKPIADLDRKFRIVDWCHWQAVIVLRFRNRCLIG